MSEYLLERAAAEVVRQCEADGREISLTGAMAVLRRWVEQTSEQMLRDVEWWTGPHSPVSHEFFGLLREEGR
jgi:hypothetical protein